MTPTLPSMPNLTLRVSGVPDEIDALAQAIKTTRERLDPIMTTVSHNYQKAIDDWYGDAANAYSRAMSSAITADSGLNTFMLDLCDVLWAYAQRVRRGQEFFANLLGNAAEVGLQLWGNTIRHPTTWLDHIPDMDNRYLTHAQQADKQLSRPVPQGHPATAITGNVGTREYAYNEALTREWNEFLRYQRLVSTYNEVAVKVGQWHREHEEWIKNNIVPLVERVPNLEDFISAYKTLRRGNEDALDFAFSQVEGRTQLNLKQFRQAHDESSLKAFDKLSGDLLGNDLKLGTYLDGDYTGALSSLELLETEIQRAAHHGNILRGVRGAGFIATIAETADGVVLGTIEAETSIDADMIVERVAQGAGSQAGKRVIASTAAGLVSRAAYSTMAGRVVGGTATFLWEVEVPLKTKDAINHWINKTVGWDPHDATLKATYADGDTLEYLVDDLGPIP